MRAETWSPKPFACVTAELTSSGGWNSYSYVTLPPSAMPKDPLLPGVTTASCPPTVICDAHRAIRNARRRALARDVMQLVLLGAVDVLFIRWPESRIPMLGRVESMAFLQAANVALLAHVWMSRKMPAWWARRVAATWSRSEQEKFQRRFS